MVLPPLHAHPYLPWVPHTPHAELTARLASFSAALMPTIAASKSSLRPLFSGRLSLRGGGSGGAAIDHHERGRQERAWALFACWKRPVAQRPGQVRREGGPELPIMLSWVQAVSLARQSARQGSGDLKVLASL